MPRAALALLPALAACLVQGEEAVFEDPSAEARALRLRSGNGLIEVIPGEALRVTRRAEHGALPFAFSQSLEGGVATLDEACPRVSDCRVETLVELPPGIALDLALDTGELRLDGVEGPLDLRAGAAAVFGLDLGEGPLTLTADKAEVDLVFVAPPRSLTLSVGVGGLAVDLPAGAYDLHARTALGEVVVSGVQLDPQAERRLDLATGAGDVWVRGPGTPGS